VLACLSRYTHWVAISNSRLVALDEAGVTFEWKDYRIKGRDRLRTMTLDAADFIRRFSCAGCRATSAASAIAACSPAALEPKTSKARFRVGSKVEAQAAASVGTNVGTYTMFMRQTT